MKSYNDSVKMIYSSNKEINKIYHLFLQTVFLRSQASVLMH